VPPPAVTANLYLLRIEGELVVVEQQSVGDGDLEAFFAIFSHLDEMIFCSALDAVAAIALTNLFDGGTHQKSEMSSTQRRHDWQDAPEPPIKHVDANGVAGGLRGRDPIGLANCDFNCAPLPTRCLGERRRRRRHAVHTRASCGRVQTMSTSFGTMRDL
jgi:hypothetical protein